MMYSRAFPFAFAMMCATAVVLILGYCSAMPNTNASECMHVWYARVR